MLKKSQLELIEFIYTQRSASSGSIASHLQLSKRTVISYVKEINSFFPGPDLILSNNKGYCLDLEVFAKVQTEMPELAHFSPEERVPFLAKKLLSSYRDKLNINEVGTQLHFSGSTIRADLYKLRDTARDYGLEVQLNYSSASLSGPELKNGSSVSPSLRTRWSGTFTISASWSSSFPSSTAPRCMRFSPPVWSGTGSGCPTMSWSTFSTACSSA